MSGKTAEWIIFSVYCALSVAVHVTCFLFVSDFWSLRKERAIVSRTPELVVINFIGVLIQLFNGILRMLHPMVDLGAFFKVSQSIALIILIFWASSTMAAIWRVDWHYTLARYEAEKVWKSELGMTLDKSLVLNLTPIFKSWQSTFVSCLAVTLVISTPLITSTMISSISSDRISVYIQITVLGLCIICAFLSLKFFQTTSRLGQTHGLRKEMIYMIFGFSLAVLTQLIIILIFGEKTGFYNILTVNCRDTTLIFAYFYVAAHLSTDQCKRKSETMIEPLANPSLHFNTVSLTASSMRGMSRSVSLHNSGAPPDLKEEARKFTGAGSSSMLLQSVLRDYESFVLLTEHCVSEMSVEGILFIVWYMRAKQMFFMFLREQGMFEFNNKSSSNLERRIRFLQLVFYPQAYESYIDEHYRDHSMIEVEDLNHSDDEPMIPMFRSKSSERDSSRRSHSDSGNSLSAEDGEIDHPPKRHKSKYPKSKSLRIISPRSPEARKGGSKTLTLPKLSLRRQSSDSKRSVMGFKDLRITVDRSAEEETKSDLPNLVGMLTDPLSCTPTPISTMTPSIGDSRGHHTRALSLEDQIIGLNDASVPRVAVMRVSTLSQDSPASIIASQPSLARPSATATLDSASDMMSSGLLVLQDTPTGTAQKTVSSAVIDEEMISNDIDNQLDESSKGMMPDTPNTGAVLSIELQAQLTIPEPSPPPPSLPELPQSPPVEETSPPQSSMSQLLDNLRNTSISPRQRFSTRWRSLSTGRLTAPRKANPASATPPPVGSSGQSNQPSLAQVMDGTVSPRPQTMRLGDMSSPMTFADVSDAAQTAGANLSIKYRKEIGTVICLPIEVFAQYQPSEKDHSVDGTRALSPSLVSQQQLKEPEQGETQIETVANMLLNVLDKYVSLEGIQCVNVSGSCRSSALRHRDRLRAISGGISGDKVLETISQSMTIEKKVRLIMQSLLCMDGVLTDVVRVLKTDIFRRFTNTVEFKFWYNKHYPHDLGSD